MISHIMINIKMLMSTRYCVTHVSKTRRHFCVLTPRRHKKEIRTVSDFIFIHSFIRSFNRQPGRRRRRRRVKKMKREGGRRWRREMKKGGKREEDEDEGGMKLKIRREGGERGRKKKVRRGGGKGLK